MSNIFEPEKQLTGKEVGEDNVSGITCLLVGSNITKGELGVKARLRARGGGRGAGPTMSRPCL